MSIASQRADERDAAFVRRALTLAKKAWGQTAPNPMVGAVVVKDDVVVGEGYHSRYGAAHAEVEALRVAGERARGATVYVSLEPCAHFGKTPPCVDALIGAGVSRVVAATRDPSTTAGGGAERLRAAGIDVTFDVEATAARELNAPFFHGIASDRPWTSLKLALSIDGAIADAGRGPAWLTGKKARREVHRLRAGSDAIAVGLGTVRADNPELTVRDAPPPRVPPARVVFTRRGELPLASVLARTATEVPTIVVAESVDLANARRLLALGVEVVAATSLEEGLRVLRQRGIRSLLVEGGAGITGALLGAGLVDRLIIFQAPVLLGAGALSGFESAPPMAASGARRYPIVRRAELDDDLMTVYALHPDLMFTGLVDDVGIIDRISDTAAGRELVIRSRYEDLADGESVAVNGACLTVRGRSAGSFTVAAVVTTMERTAIGDWFAGMRVNLERSLRASDRLGGHIVQGHVDGVGTVRRVQRFDDAVLVDVAVPPDVAELLVPHGSITVDGVSLTVNAIPDAGVVQLSLIEYTLRHTTLGALEAGDLVHVEGDVIGKYVRQLVAPYARESGIGNRESQSPGVDSRFPIPDSR